MLLDAIIKIKYIVEPRYNQPYYNNNQKLMH